MTKIYYCAICEIRNELILYNIDKKGNREYYCYKCGDQRIIKHDQITP